MAQMTNISIVCPAYNEAENLPDLIKGLVNTVKKLDLNAEIIVVNDGSTDNSKEILDQLERENDVTVLHHNKNLGKTQAFITGFKHSSGDIIFMFETDLQYEPSELKRFLDALDWGYDVASGWRAHRIDPVYRLWLSKIYNFVLRTIFKIRISDNNSGFKAFRRKVIDDLLSEPADGYYGFHRFMTILAFKKGYRIVNVPISHYPRVRGKSHISVLKAGYHVLHDIIKTLRRTR